MTIYDAVKEYSVFLKLDMRPVSAERYLGHVRRLCVYFKNCEIQKITDRDILDYLHLLRSLDFKPNGIAQLATDIKHFLRYVSKKKWLSFDPELIPNIPREYPLPRVGTDENYQKILQAVDTGLQTKWNKKNAHVRNKALIMMLWDTGARNGEICSLDEKDIDTVHMKAVVRSEKRKSSFPFREIYWTQETNQALEQWLEIREELKRLSPDSHAPVFFGITGGSYGRITNTTVGDIMREYSRKAGIPVFNPHSARHHFGHDLATKNANLPIISGLMGHTNFESSKRYTDLNNVERESMYNRFKRNALLNS